MPICQVDLATVSSAPICQVWDMISLVPPSFPEDARSPQEVRHCGDRVRSDSAAVELGSVPTVSHQCFSGYSKLLPMGRWPWRDHNSWLTWFCYQLSRTGFWEPKPRAFLARPTLVQVYGRRSPWWWPSAWGTFSGGEATRPGHRRSLGSLLFQLFGPSQGNWFYRFSI